MSDTTELALSEISSFSLGTKKPPPNDNFSVLVPLQQTVMFITLLENIEVLFDGTGVIRKASLEGQLVIRNFTSSNPKVLITFNNDLTVGRSNLDASTHGKALDYCTFHECASFTKWDAQRILELKCPSGTFILMKYLVLDDFAKPFNFSTLVEEGPYEGHLEVVIKITSLLEENQKANNVILLCPIPKSTISVNFSLGDTKQECEYDKTAKKIKWKLNTMSHASESSIRVKLNLGQEKGNHKRELGPLSLSFEIPNIVYANVSIKSFVLEDDHSPHPPQKWIKLITKSLSYESRVDFSHSNISRIK